MSIDKDELLNKLKELLEDDSKMKALLIRELNESCRIFHSPRRTRVYNKKWGRQEL